MSHPTTILDHIIHLSPPRSLEETTAEFTRLGFTVIPGGTHTDGLTSNALIVLPDGVYVELIYFNQSPHPPTHRWGKRQLGWIDVADLGFEENLYKVINGRYSSSEAELYSPGFLGGRDTPAPDSKRLEWRVTFSNTAVRKGELPFFCEDLTPREWRVPADPPSNTQHANGVLGVARLIFVTPSDNFAAFSEQLTATTGLPPSTTEDGNHVWALTTQVEGKRAPSLVLRTADPSIEAEVARGTGIYEVHFWISGSESRVSDSKWGRISFISIDTE